MVERVEEKPGLLEGLGKEFFKGIPYSHFGLSRTEQLLGTNLRQTELTQRQILETRRLETGQDRERIVAEGILGETQKTREEVSELAPVLRQSAIAQMAIDGRLQSLEESLVETGENIVGIPSTRKSIAELLHNGEISDIEAVVLVGRGVLDSSQAEELLKRLPQWKLEVIRSGLATRYDPGTERQLHPPQKAYLAQLRRALITPTAHLSSLEPLARNRLLGSEVHHKLATRIREVRFGVEAGNYGIRELNEQTDRRISQGEIQIAQGSQQIGDNRIARSQRETTNRLIHAGILQGNRLIELEERNIETQTAQLLVQTDMAGKVTTIRDLAVKAGEDRTAIRTSTESTAYSAGTLVELAEQASIDRQELIHGLRSLALTERGYGELQVRQMDEAQITREGQLAIMERIREIGEFGSTLLLDLSRTAKTLVRVEEAQLEELGKLNEGVVILQQIAAAQLETSQGIQGGLEHLQKILEEQGINICRIVKATIVTLLDIEKRTMERDNSRDRIAAEESFRKAMEMLRRGKIDKAIKYLDESEERWPADFRIYYERGLCYVAKNDSTRAKQEFLESIDMVCDEEKKKERALVRLNLARLYYSEARLHLEKGEMEAHDEKLLQAIEETKKAVEEDPGNDEAHFALAIYLAAFKLVDEALEILMELIRRNPEFAKKILHFDVFQPLMAILKHTLAEEFQEKDDKSIAKVNLAIAKDCLAVGDLETAIRCISLLLDNWIVFLRDSRFVEDSESSIVHGRITEKLKENVGANRYKKPEELYAALNIALQLKSASAGEDATETGDLETAIECISLLLDNYVQFLKDSKFIENTQSSVVRTQTAKKLGINIDTGKYKTFEEWYSALGIALQLKLPAGKIYKAFLLGAKLDPDFTGKNVPEIRAKLERIVGTQIEYLLRLIRTKHPADFPWLITNI